MRQLQKTSAEVVPCALLQLCQPKSALMSGIAASLDSGSVFLCGFLWDAGQGSLRGDLSWALAGVLWLHVSLFPGFTTWKFRKGAAACLVFAGPDHLVPAVFQ